MSACGLLELRKTVIEKTFTILFHKPHVKFHKMKQSKNLTEAKWRLGLKICEGRRAYRHAPAFSRCGAGVGVVHNYGADVYAMSLERT